MVNQTKRTPKREHLLLDALGEGFSVTAACRRAGVGRATYYEWRKADPLFAASADDAVEAGTDLLEDAARERAVVDKSDTMIIFLLKARRPQYRESTKSEVTLNVDKAAETIAAEVGLPVDEVLSVMPTREAPR